MPQPKLSLSSGVTYGYGADGKRVCTGSQMGRSNLLPDDPRAPIKLRMVKITGLHDDYDEWGAYWGIGHPIYCAFKYEPLERADKGGEFEEFSSKHLEACIFVRATHRVEAKALIRALVPKAKFYR